MKIFDRPMKLEKSTTKIKKLYKRKICKWIIKKDEQSSNWKYIESETLSIYVCEINGTIEALSTNLVSSKRST